MICPSGSPGRARSPAAAKELSDRLVSLFPVAPLCPVAHCCWSPLFLLYPCTGSATAGALLPDGFSTTSSPNWRAFRRNALICFSFIWASYSS